MLKILPLLTAVLLSCGSNSVHGEQETEDTKVQQNPEKLEAKHADKSQANHNPNKQSQVNTIAQPAISSVSLPSSILATTYAQHILNVEPNADTVPHSTFAQAPFIHELAQQISSNSGKYMLEGINFTQINQNAKTSTDLYYLGDDGLSSMLVKNTGENFTALLNYQGKSYRFNATTVSLVTDELNHPPGAEASSHEHASTPAPSNQSNGFKNSLWQSYQMHNAVNVQSRMAGKSFYKNFVDSGVKKVRVLVSENAIIEEYENSGEVNFSSLYERIQTGIDFANLALVTSGVEALQLEVSDIAIQRLPENYEGDVVAQDVFKRLAFPIWGEQNATFQMTALALTQNKADIIYNLGAREYFQNNACGFATIGVNGEKVDPASYSTDHTYPIAINVKLGCETGRTPVHELGHTIGLHHERDNTGNNIVAGSSTPYAYNFGFTSPDTPAYSIMSYGLGCTQTHGSASCERANFFSSPKLRFGDAAFGVSTPDPEAADAVRFLNDTWALRFSNHVKPMSISPLQDGGFILNWDTVPVDADSLVLVVSRSAHLRYNYVLDNHAVYNHEKMEIPLQPGQTSYIFDTNQMRELGLQNTRYDTVSLFTGHVNEYDDIIPHLQAQLHAGYSLFTQDDADQNTVIMVDGSNLETPKAGDSLTFTFDVSNVPDFSVNNVKLMTVLDDQYHAGFTTAVARREFNPTNPMLNFFDYELLYYAPDKVELRLHISDNYKDYAGFLRNRETSNYKLPIVGFYLTYQSNQRGENIETRSQEVAIDLTSALGIVPFIQAESLVKVIDNDRLQPLSLIFNSTQEIALSDIYTRVQGASFYQIGDVVSSVKQLPPTQGKFQYEVTLQNPDAIDDEGDFFASVSFGIDNLNLFSTSMVIASSNLMFEENNASRVRVSSQIEMPLSFSVTNLPQGDFDEEVSISTPDVGDTTISVKGNLKRVNEQQGIVSFMFDPKALNKPSRLRVNAQTLVGKSADKKKAQHWVDVEYNVAPTVVAQKTNFTGSAGDTIMIPIPRIDDPDGNATDVSYAWHIGANAPGLTGQEANIEIQIAKDAVKGTVYDYSLEVTDGIDTVTQAYTVTVQAPVVVNTPPISTTPPAPIASNSISPAQNNAAQPEQSGGTIGVAMFVLLLPMALYRRLVNPA